MGGFSRIYQKEDGTFTTESTGPNIYTGLAYAEETRVIYYYSWNSLENHMFAPYISKKGKFCRFIQNQIVEIN